MATTYPASKHSHYALVPGHQNTTTKEPTVRPPDMRLVSALASKGPTLNVALKNMNMGPSGRDTMLQHLTTRDVLFIPDLFEVSSGFVMPPDPWDKGDGSQKTIYQRLVEEIHHAGRREASENANAYRDRSFSTDEDGLFKDDAGGLFKAWHKTTARAAGDGLADDNGRDGNGHLIVNDKDCRWQQAQQRGEAPMYTAVHQRIEDFFQMRIQGKRYNHYRDMTNWKPFHFDSAALDKDAGKGKGGGGCKGGKGGKGGGRPHMSQSQNMTVGVSFGEARQAAFEWAGARGREGCDVPDHLQSPAASTGSHKNVVLSLTVPDSSTYTFGRDVNLLWRHGIIAEKPPAGRMGGRIDVEEGRISIIAWGWVDQYDELDEYMGEASAWAAPQQRERGGGGGRGAACWGRDEGRGRGGLDGRGRGGVNQSEAAERVYYDRHDRRDDDRDRRDDDRDRGRRDDDRDRDRRDRDHDRRGRRDDEREREGDRRDRDHDRRDERDRPMQGGRADAEEMARREARAAKFATH